MNETLHRGAMTNDHPNYACCFTLLTAYSFLMVKIVEGYYANVNVATNWRAKYWLIIFFFIINTSYKIVVIFVDVKIDADYFTF